MLVRCLILLLLLWSVGGISGCGKPPTWNELVNQVTQPPPPPTTPEATPAEQPTQPVMPSTPAPPPKPDPHVVIAQFKQLKPHEIDDHKLGLLLSLDEGLEQITELDMKGSSVTDQGLQQIGKLSQLRFLDIRSTQFITANSFPAIAQATSLEELRVDPGKITDESLAVLRPLSELQRFDLRGVKLSYAGYAELLHHKKLIELDLRDSNMDDQALDVVTDLPELERLWLGRTRVTDEGVKKLAKLERLHTLDLTDCRVTGRTFGNMPKGGVEVLVMTNTMLNEQGANAIKQMKNLRVLILTHLGTMQDVHLMQMVRPLTDLEELNVSNCPLLTSECMRAVLNHKNLRHVEFGHCPRITDTVFKYLETCKNLKKIIATSTGCSAAGMQYIKSKLPECEVHL
ncbi:MAG: hypothetical protein KatS3mg113_0556 [Planctomycetaceae bacterium]|nr:MAG: hypothetical protein KatS3mg113_0556 [Planctomycetaceae bacterium]